MTEKTVGDVEKMVRVALVVWFSLYVGIVKETNSAHFVRYDHNRFA